MDNPTDAICSWCRELFHLHGYTPPELTPGDVAEVEAIVLTIRRAHEEEIVRLRAEKAVVLATLEEYAANCDRRAKHNLGVPDNKALINRARGVRAAAKFVELAMQEAAEAKGVEMRECVGCKRGWPMVRDPWLESLGLKVGAHVIPKQERKPRTPWHEPPVELVCKAAEAKE